MLAQRVLWFWVATWLFLAGRLSHGALQVNLGHTQQLELITAFVFYLGFSLVWVVEMIWRFGRHDGS